MLSEYVKQARKERHMTQAELGEALFVSKQAVGKWERNEALPAPELIVKIAKYFNVSVDELLGNDATGAKNPADNVSEVKREMIELVDRLSDDQVRKLLQIANAALEL